MKIGILTFHSQLNYGGVLQAFALQTALKIAGYDVVIVDRWLTPENRLLLGPLHSGTFKSRVNACIRALFGIGLIGQFVRYEKTIRFVRKKLNLTPYHFHQWKEMNQKDLGIDILVVGSDQVWHGGDWGEPLVYLLEGAPKLAAISYAASFGMRALPDGLINQYKEGFKRFSAISVREAEGACLVKSCGVNAEQVVDPTLLLDPNVWHMAVRKKKARRPLLICYFISENIDDLLPMLIAFADEMRCDVKILCDKYQHRVEKSFKQLLRHFQWGIRQRCSSVKIEISVGPQDFIDLFAQSTWILSDSFHALMFATIFEKQCAILKPSQLERQMMFARIEEFVTACTSGPVIEENVCAALQRFRSGIQMSYRYGDVTIRREMSWQWFINALAATK